MTPHPPVPPGAPEQLYLDNVDLIGRLAAGIARGRYASVEEAEEFTQELHCKLIADDYAIFRKFKWTSSLKTYLTTVAANAFKDFRIQRRGRWRPSAAAMALGPVAVRLDELLSKEGRSFDEACEILRTNHHVPESRRQLEEIWKRLPPKAPRRMEGEEQLADLAAPGVRPEAEIFEHELRETRGRVRKALDKAMRDLPEEDRFIIRLVILKGVKIVTVAEILNTEPKPLYRRVGSILKGLRSTLERGGVRWEQVADLLNRSDAGWGFSGRNPKKPEEK